MENVVPVTTTEPGTENGLWCDLSPGEFIMVTRGELMPQVIGGGGGIYGGGASRVEHLPNHAFDNQILKVVAIDGPVCIVKTLGPKDSLYGREGNRVLNLSKVEYRKVAKEVAAALNPPKED